MTKVSKLPLRPDVWQRIFELFVNTLADEKDKKNIALFVNDFFSPTEQIMFAKRLAAAVLLAKNHDYDSIRRILQVSPPTIAKISLKIKFEDEDKGINLMLKNILKKQAAQVVWKEIEELFNLPTKSSLKSPDRLKRNFLNSKRTSQIKSEF
jgi:uncharacterized protein YerC